MYKYVKCMVIRGEYRNRVGKSTMIPDKDGKIMFYPKEANPHRVKLSMSDVTPIDCDSYHYNIKKWKQKNKG